MKKKCSLGNLYIQIRSHAFSGKLSSFLMLIFSNSHAHKQAKNILSNEAWIQKVQPQTYIVNYSWSLRIYKHESFLEFCNRNFASGGRINFIQPRYSYILLQTDIVTFLWSDLNLTSAVIHGKDQSCFSEKLLKFRNVRNNLSASIDILSRSSGLSGD